MICNWIAAHPVDTAIAVVLAVSASLLIEIFRFIWRDLRGLIAPRTFKEIDRRIKEYLEFRRIITNEKALYLAMFRSVFGILGLFCTAAATFILSFLTDAPEEARSLRFGSIAMLLVISLLCIFSMRTTLLDAKEKLDARVAKIDGKIARLRERRANLLPK
jgi:apolipoprotein N-acyltransferase